MIDSTGSMSNWIEGVKNKCEEISRNLKVNIKNFDMKFGGVFYRDPIDEPSDENEHQPLGSVENLKAKMVSISAIGGGDTPEDWVGGYRLALDKVLMKWRKNSIKIIIHIADAGAHSLRFSDGDTKHNNPDMKLD